MTAPRYTTLSLVSANVRTPTNTAQAHGYDPNTGDMPPLLLQNILAAEAAIDAYCGRRFDGYTGRAAARQFPVRRTGSILTDDYASAPTAVEGSMTGVYEKTDWHPLVYPDGDRPGYGLLLWSRCFNRREMVEVTAIWGWAAVPPQVVNAATLYASRLFARSSSPVGMQIMEQGAAYVAKIDPDVKTLLAPFSGRGVI